MICIDCLFFVRKNRFITQSTVDLAGLKATISGLVGLYIH